MASISATNYVIVAPCFNESNAIIPFLKKLETALQKINERFTVILVDDCSTDNSLQLIKSFDFSASNVNLHVLSLQYNCGHQVAIYAEKN